MCLICFMFFAREHIQFFRHDLVLVQSVTATPWVIAAQQRDERMERVRYVAACLMDIR